PGSDPAATLPGSDPGRSVTHSAAGSDPGRSVTHSADAGRVVQAAGDELVVAGGGGTALRILEIQPEGRRTMTAREFLAGRRLTAGDRFGT
ncbi:MAG TPA: hypothetical protein VNR64_09395, partial [Vicinamibacterales bacterium]|nr:hypothetical protein [Vicinamibacterales bacterium]